MLEIVICEDNLQYLNALEYFVEDVIKNSNIKGRLVLKTNNPEDVKKFVQSKTANVFLLDINLKNGNNGYELAILIREKIKFAYIVFVTEHLEFVLQAFKVRAFDFLPKPATKGTIKKCLLDIYNDYVERNSSTEDNLRVLTVKSGSSIFRIKIEDIMFIEKLQNKAIIHTINNQISCYESLEYFERNLLNDSCFVRCHKSYIVNKRYIQEIRSDKMEVVLENGQICYIGRKYKGGFR